MKRLFLLRHAKAVPASRDADDHARKLAEQGRADAALMASYIRQKKYLPDLVLCSDSARTRETLDVGRAITGMRPCVEYRADLYLAEPSVLLSILQDVPAQTASVMVVGHNPGLEQIVSALKKKELRGPEEYRSMLDEKFPTSSLAIFDFDIVSWAKLTPRSGMLTDFKIPKELTA